jgi:hypothetical protein
MEHSLASNMDRFYEDAESLFVRACDTFYVGGAPIAGDWIGKSRSRAIGIGTQ